MGYGFFFLNLKVFWKESCSNIRSLLHQFNDLQECYLQKRKNWARQAQKQEERDFNHVQREGYHPGLKDFQSVLSSFTRYGFVAYVAFIFIIFFISYGINLLNVCLFCVVGCGLLLNLGMVIFSVQLISYQGLLNTDVNLFLFIRSHYKWHLHKTSCW